MPTYEYECKNCGHQLEAFQKITENPLTECPECHHASLSKLISAASFQLKGTGWYKTDFSNKGKPPKETTPDKKTDDTTKKEKKETKTDNSSTSSGTSKAE